MMVCASSVAFQVTIPGIVFGIRINWLFLLLVVVTISPWPDCQAAFRARFIPQGVMDQKKREFRNLTQGNKTVDAY